MSKSNLENTEAASSESAAAASSNATPAEPAPLAAEPAHVPSKQDLGAAVRRGAQFVKEHPLSAIAVVAAAGALVEVELAVGLVVGAGMGLALADEDGKKLSGELAQRFGKLAARVREARSELQEKAPPEAPAPPA